MTYYFTFVILPLQLLQKLTSKFINFLLTVIHISLSYTYYYNILLTQQQLSVVCEICCEFFIFQRNNVEWWACAASVSLSPISDLWNCIHHVYFIKPVAPTPKSEPSKLQNLHKNSAAGLPRKIHNVIGTSLWYGSHGIEQRITNNATDEWCKRHWVCLCKRTTFLVFNLTTSSTLVYI